ncbi:MAG: hypothetical protein RIQ79_800 [Verrucomicrobiota bacterium]
MNSPTSIAGLYQALLHRQPSQDEQESAEKIIAMAGSVSALAQQLLSSREYLLRNHPEELPEYKELLGDILGRLKDRRIVIVDIGAQLLSFEGHVYQPLLKAHPRCRIIGFEPLDHRRAERSAAEGETDLVLLPDAIGDGQLHYLHINNDDGTSSLLPLAQHDNSLLDGLSHLHTVKQIPLPTKTLDTALRDEPQIDYIKIDVQGVEELILKNAPLTLGRAAVLHCELQFSPIYEGASHFSEVEIYLREQGWEFIGFHYLHNYPYVTGAAFPTADKLSWGDAIFFRRLKADETPGDLNLIQALVALTVYKKASLAAHLIRSALLYNTPPVPTPSSKFAFPIPPEADWDGRVAMTCRCRDAASIPKVPNSGAVVTDESGHRIQIMHNGVKVVADGYCGAWMTDLITRLNGHHEPQEELIFHAILRQLPAKAVMLELGAFWSYYSLWFASEAPGQRRAVAVEPDPNHLMIGRENARLNNLELEFIQASIGTPGRSLFQTESAGHQLIERIDVPALFKRCQFDNLDVLHCDAQGAELSVIESCEELLRDHRINFLIVSTHAMPISGDALTHQKCLLLIRKFGGYILAEHDVHESFSGDGLIAAYFGAAPLEWKTPTLSYNRYSESLYRNPLYDLALNAGARQPRATAAEPAPSLGKNQKSDEKFISYAQNFEDVMLWRALKHVSTGFYIDVGANDPEGDSVTKAFYDRGWHGINIEPSPKYFARLEHARPRDTCIRAAVSDNPGHAPFWDVKDMGLSSLDPQAAKDCEARGLEVDKIEVQLLTLDSILEHTPTADIHFLKIDVEGHEAAVLRSINLARYRPWIILLESTLPNTQISSHHEWEPRLLDHNYEFVYQDGLNRFYVAREQSALKTAFTCPPNVFDAFEVNLTSQLRHQTEGLQKSFTFAEKDRSERLDVIHAQGRRIAELELLVHATEQDRANWMRFHEELNAANTSLSNQVASLKTMSLGMECRLNSTSTQLKRITRNLWVRLWQSLRFVTKKR